MSKIIVHRIRRQPQRGNSSITSLLDEFTLNQVEALRKAHEMFGREDFESTMKIFLRNHCVKFAFVLTVKFFMKQKER